MDIEAIRKRAEKATKGPWVRESTDDTDRDIALGYDIPGEGYPNLVATCYDDEPEHKSEGPARPITRRQAQANAKFIAHAREDVPALCDEVERLRAVIFNAIVAAEEYDDDCSRGTDEPKPFMVILRGTIPELPAYEA